MWLEWQLMEGPPRERLALWRGSLERVWQEKGVWEKKSTKRRLEKNLVVIERDWVVVGGDWMVVRGDWMVAGGVWKVVGRDLVVVGRDWVKVKNKISEWLKRYKKCEDGLMKFGGRDWVMLVDCKLVGWLNRGCWS